MTVLSPRTSLLFCLLLLPAWSTGQATRDYVYLVGSSTVYPFATVVAERFGRSTRYKTPKVESTGSGGGFKLFCDGVGVDFPDITNSSRPIKDSELRACELNGVTDVVEVKFGYDGIVLAQSADAESLSLTMRDLYLAIARDVPGEKPGEFVANPYRYWSDINDRLPRKRIEVYGPPPTSGTRDELVEQAMETGCHTFPALNDLADTDVELHRRICQTVREDGVYIETGENDNLIVQKLQSNPRAIGIFGFSYLDQNLDKLRGVPVNGVAPEYDLIANGNYPISRPLYFYVKKVHVNVIPGLRAFLGELTSERAWGEEGYLSDRGLVSMPAGERVQVANNVRELVTLPLAAK